MQHCRAQTGSSGLVPLRLIRASSLDNEFLSKILCRFLEIVQTNAVTTLRITYCDDASKRYVDSPIRAETMSYSGSVERRRKNTSGVAGVALILLFPELLLLS